MSELKELKDFPSYYIDVENGAVFLRVYGMQKEVPHFFTKGDSQRKYTLRTKYGRKNVSLGRLIASVEYNCEYDKLPKALAFIWTKENGLTIRTRSESTTIGNITRRERLKATQEERIAIVDRTIMEIQLVRDAYYGNIKPIADYLWKNRGKYISKVNNYSRIWRECKQNDVPEIVDDCILTLLTNIGNGSKNIVLIEPWIYKTAIFKIKARKYRREVASSPFIERK